jgi:hypothetical protein
MITVSGMLNTDSMNWIDCPKCHQPAGRLCTDYRGRSSRPCIPNAWRTTAPGSRIAPVYIRTDLTELRRCSHTTGSSRSLTEEFHSQAYGDRGSYMRPCPGRGRLPSAWCPWTEMVIADRLADVELIDLHAVYFVPVHCQHPKPRHLGTIRNPTWKDWFNALI